MSSDHNEHLDPNEYGEIPDESEQLDQDQFQSDSALTGETSTTCWTKG